MRRVHAVWAGATGALVIALITVMTIDWAPIAGEEITRSASRALGRSVTIAGPIRIRPAFSGLKGAATGIVIGSPEWARSDEFASIDAAEITFSWLPLIVGNLEPGRIEIRGVLFELESRKTGSGFEASWQVGPLDPRRSSRSGSSLRFGRLPRVVMEDAALAVTDAYGQLHDIAVRRFKLRRKGRGAVATALLGEAGSPVKLDWSVASLEALKSGASEMELKIESRAGTVTADGKLGLNPDAGFELRSFWDLSALGRFGRNFGLTGLPDRMPLAATVRMAGRADAFAVQLDKLESGRSRLHGVLQGGLVRQGGPGPTYNLLELTGEIASQSLDATPLIAAFTGAQNAPGGEKPAGSSMVDFLFGPGLVVKLDVEVSALELDLNDTILKSATGRIISDARLIRLSNFSGKLGKGLLALDLVMDRSGTAVQDVAVLFSGRDLDLGWLFDGLGMESLLIAPTDFSGELRAGGANGAEMQASLTGAVHFASGHGALRGAAARGLTLSGVRLPRLDGKEALPLECVAGRMRFSDGIGVLDGFTMRGAGYEVRAQGYADLGRQMLDMRFSPTPLKDRALPDTPSGVPYLVAGPINTLRVSRAGEEPASQESSEPAPARVSLPPLRGEVAQNNPCLAEIRAADKDQTTARSGAQ